MASKAREGCQPVRLTSSLPGLPKDAPIGHVSRGEQKAQTTSQQSPGTASACKGLIDQGSCVKADRDFSRSSRGNDNRHILYFDAQIDDFFRLRDSRFWEFNYASEAHDFLNRGSERCWLVGWLSFLFCWCD